MLLRSDLACSVPNSLTPVSADFLAFMAQRDADQTARESQYLADWLALLDRKPESFCDLGMDWRNFAWPNPGLQTINLTPGAGNGIDSNEFGTAAQCSPTFSDAPEILDMGGGPGTPFEPVPPLTTPPMLPPVTNVAPPAPRVATGKVCADLRSGMVMQSQVSREQLYACAAAGWQGSQASPPEIVRQALNGSLPFLGTPDPNPEAPPAGGMSGVDGPSAAEFVVAGVGLAALWWIAKNWRGVMA